MNELKELFSKIDFLFEDTKPTWGSMDAHQMIEHLIMALRISNGKLVMEKVIFPEEKLPILKRFLMSSKPLPKNFNNPVVGSLTKEYIFSTFSEAVNELKKEFVVFELYFNENPDATPLNPTYGKLNRDEWIQFHKKHFTHHYLQFGLIID